MKVEGLAAATMMLVSVVFWGLWAGQMLTPPRCELQRSLREHIGRHVDDEDASDACAELMEAARH